MIWPLLFAVGITLVFTEGSIFSWFRTKLKVLGCPLCVGTWVGMAVRSALVTGGGWSWRLGLEVLGFGCLTGVLALIGYQVIEFLDQATGKEA